MGVAVLLLVPPTLGTMLHYEDTVLNDFYFVDPQWLCDLLAHIVTVRQINPFVVDGMYVCTTDSNIFENNLLGGILLWPFQVSV